MHEACFDEIGVDFNKGSVAKRIRRDLIRCSKSGTFRKD